MNNAAKKVFVLVSFFLLLFLAQANSGAKASQIGEVNVTSMGFGSTPAQAAQDALVNAIAQVNGEAVAASTKLKQTSTTVRGFTKHREANPGRGKQEDEGGR